MNKSPGAAALLSALVFPGVGQWYLGRRKLALLFALPALLAGYVYLNHALGQADAIAAQVLSGSMPLDPAAISARLESAPTPPLVSACGIVFALCWGGSVLEALLRK